MKNIFKFIVIVAIGLVTVTVAGSIIVHRTSHAWFAKDITLRSSLAAKGARHSIVNYWTSNNRIALKELLSEISHDERILGAAACGTERLPFAATDDFPLALDCRQLLADHDYNNLNEDGVGFRLATSRGAVFINLILINNNAIPLGFIAFIHDLSYAENRESQTQNALILTALILGVSVCIITIFATRVAWKNWSREVRAALRGELPNSGDFSLILSDVRALTEKLVAEREIDHKDGIWNADRLKQTLTHYLQDDTVIIVGNREPYIHELDSNGQVRFIHPASGLVTALEPVMRACSGKWVAHGSGSADRSTVDSLDHIKVPPGAEAYTLRRLWLTSEEEDGYYYGFSNEGLWPLCHMADTRPTFRSGDWEQYVKINKRFADAACDEADVPDPIILVQDYHLALVPRFIRERLPKATIISFWHIPWPTAERFGICPQREEIVHGLLGSSVIGFHTQAHCNNFIDSVERFSESKLVREHSTVFQKGRPVVIRPYPISVEWPIRWLSGIPSIEACRKEIFNELKLPPDAVLGIGVDRLDYTKGVEERLLAIERILEKHPEYVGRLFFAQLAAPSRVKIDKYKELNERVEQLAERINARFGAINYEPIKLLRSHHEPERVFRYFRAADFCYVSSLHDGMNLVAKEFVASRDDLNGVLILSQFTGAATDLSEALIVNPYDIDQAADAIFAALEMTATEKALRIKAMRALLSEFNVYRWAGRMLVDAARIRRRERLTGELTVEPSIL